jgi:NADH-quinone oxidoreductase E subunit
MNAPIKNASIAEILKNYDNPSRDKLIPVLQDVQNAQGYLSQEAMIEISNCLKLPVSKVFGVASFYNQFKFQPRGKYEIQVCRGTACHVQGSSRVLDAIKKHLKIEAGETTRDGLFTLEVVACIGACGLAPVISINGEFYASLTPEKVVKILDQYINKKESKDDE